MTLRRLVAGAASTTLVVAALSLAPVSSAVADELPVAADSATPTLSVPELVELGLGGQPVPLDIAVTGTEEGDSVTVDLVLADASADIVSLSVSKADGTWSPVAVTTRPRPADDTTDAVGSFAFEPGLTKVRLGIPFDVSVADEPADASAGSFAAGSLAAGERRSAALRRDGAAAALGGRVGTAAGAPAAGAVEVAPLALTTSLTVNDAPVGDEHETTVRMLAPSITLEGELPGTVSAGATFPFRLTVDNRTGSAYTEGSQLEGADYDSTLAAVISGVLLTEDDMSSLEFEDESGEYGAFPPLDPEEVAVSCAPAGETPALLSPARSELLEAMAQPLLVGTASLADDASVSFDCEVAVSDEAPDGLLLLRPDVTVGSYGFPLSLFADDGGEWLGAEIVGSGVDGPTTDPTPPPAARPVPATGTMTGTLPKTGSTSGSLAAYGLTLFLTGLGVLLATRRRRTA